MAMDMLRQLAGSPLPATFRTAAEIDQIKAVIIGKNRPMRCELYGIFAPVNIFQRI